MDRLVGACAFAPCAFQVHQSQLTSRHTAFGLCSIRIMEPVPLLRRFDFLTLSLRRPRQFCQRLQLQAVLGRSTSPSRRHFFVAKAEGGLQDRATAAGNRPSLLQTTEYKVQQLPYHQQQHITSHVSPFAGDAEPNKLQRPSQTRAQS